MLYAAAYSAVNIARIRAERAIVLYIPYSEFIKQYFFFARERLGLLFKIRNIRARQRRNGKRRTY